MREAIEAYLEAIKADPSHSKAWNNLGITYISLKVLT